MDLKVFAHRGEAQAFFKNHSLRGITGPINELYRGPDYLLLIAGEGVQSTTQKLGHTLALHPEIEHVTNLGVAGSLSPELKIGEIISLRTIYRQIDQKMEFTSFTTDGGLWDGLTTHQRVLTEEKRNELSCFGHIVDREAWAVGSTCHYFNIPFSVIKLISDGHQNNGEICQWVKESASEFSDKLFLHQQNTISNTSPKNNHGKPQKDCRENLQENFQNDFKELEGLYFTIAQKRKFKNLLNHLNRKGYTVQSILDEVNFPDILEKKILPKKKTILLLSKMTELLNPFHSKITKKLNKLSEVFDNGQFRVHYDKNLENHDVNLHATISHQKHIEDLITSLHNYRYDLVKEVFSGNLDV